MSSSIYMKFREPIKIEDWMKFCKEMGISFSPNTCGQHTFYRGKVEIGFGVEDGELPRDMYDVPDFDNAKPPNEASEMWVSTFFMGDLQAVRDTYNLIRERFKTKYVHKAPELRGD